MWCLLYGECGLCSLAIDEGACVVLEMLYSLKEGDEDDFPSLVIQLIEGGFVANFEDVEGMFQWSVEFYFVVIEGDDIRRFFCWRVGALVFGGLMVTDGCEVYFDICMDEYR